VREIWPYTPAYSEKKKRTHPDWNESLDEFFVVSINFSNITSVSYVYFSKYTKREYRMAVIIPIADNEIPTTAILFRSDLLPQIPAKIPRRPITQPKAGITAAHKLKMPSAVEASA
jgi:hypothetical protein